MAPWPEFRILPRERTGERDHMRLTREVSSGVVRASVAHSRGIDLNVVEGIAWCRRDKLDSKTIAPTGDPRNLGGAYWAKRDLGSAQVEDPSGNGPHGNR